MGGCCACYHSNQPPSKVLSLCTLSQSTRSPSLAAICSGPIRIGRGDVLVGATESVDNDNYLRYRGREKVEDVYNALLCLSWAHSSLLSRRRVLFSLLHLIVFEVFFHRSCLLACSALLTQPPPFRKPRPKAVQGANSPPLKATQHAQYYDKGESIECHGQRLFPLFSPDHMCSPFQQQSF